MVQIDLYKKLETSLCTVVVLARKRSSDKVGCKFIREKGKNCDLHFAHARKKGSGKKSCLQKIKCALLQIRCTLVHIYSGALRVR